MHIGTDRILVTGATGQQGGATTRELLAAGHKFRTMTLNPSGNAARALAALGAEVVGGNLDDEASLASALAGACGVFDGPEHVGSQRGTRESPRQANRCGRPVGRRSALRLLGRTLRCATCRCEC